VDKENAPFDRLHLIRLNVTTFNLNIKARPRRNTPIRTSTTAIQSDTPNSGTSRRIIPILDERSVTILQDAKKNPDYKEYENLAKYLSDRGRIFSRERSGVCSRHQRRLATEVKRARFLALLPY